MKNPLFFTCSLLTIGLISFCYNPGELSYDSDEERIIGNWDWLGTSGGIGGISITPETEGYRMTWKFDVEDTLRIWKDMSLGEIHFYHLGFGLTIFSQDSLPVIFFDSSPVFAYHFSGNDTLWLNENFHDGFTYQLKRE